MSKSNTVALPPYLTKVGYGLATKDYPWFITFNDRERARTLYAWLDKGQIYVKIDCQVHTLKDWREKGSDILFSHEYQMSHPLKTADISVLLTDPAKGIKSLQAELETYKKNNKDALVGVQWSLYQLNTFLDAIEKMLLPVQEENARKQKARAAKKADAAKVGTDKKK